MDCTVFSVSWTVQLTAVECSCVQFVFKILPIFDPSHPCLPVNLTGLHLPMSVQWTVHTELYTHCCTVLTSENSTVLYSSLQQPVIFLFLSSPPVTRKEPGLGWGNHTHTHSHILKHTRLFFSFLLFLFLFFFSSVLIFYKDSAHWVRPV